MSAPAAAKETCRGAPSVIAAACLAQASASSLSAIPWWPGVQSKVVLPAHLLSIRLWSTVSAEPLWIALRSDWLSVHMAAAACDSKIHSSALRMSAFSLSYDEVVPGCRRVHSSCLSLPKGRRRGSQWDPFEPVPLVNCWL